ncbi:MAG: acyl-CoA dehydratase activase-related protein [Bacteroidia bacterium]|nr:acyl-CoA dehydratase activase-related protein [Bacteroidia bacterium]
MKAQSVFIGIDIGSITVKVVAYDTASRVLLWNGYRRHHARQLDTAVQLLADVHAALSLPPHTPVAVTGSGAQQAAGQEDLPYVQEVNALMRAVRTLHPQARSVIELGGEDAKMVSIDLLDNGETGMLPVMNEKCAAGTGSMIDRMMARMDLTPEQATGIAYRPGARHPIAAKCGVFAETDVVGLLKSGIAREELVCALFEAIVQQNLATLARGRTPLPQVLLLGGPHLYYPALVQCWKHRLSDLWRARGIEYSAENESAVLVPAYALFLPAIGAVLELERLGKCNEQTESIEERLRRASMRDTGKLRSRIAFASDKEYRDFAQRYTPEEFHAPDLSRQAVVRVHLGIDCGSTSIKGVLLDESMQVLRKDFSFATHDPIEDARRMLFRLRESVEEQGAGLEILSVGTTGYAKDVLAAVLHSDISVVETIAHKEAAHAYFPDADVICDVGGQDIKVMLLREGSVADFRLNTQCSAGTGYFLQTVADRFDTSIYRFAEEALAVEYAPEFSAGCTIFLQSDIVNFMRAGYTAGEIMAGVTQVLPVNIWVYSARIYDLPSAGRVYVLQGGTQRNLAAVRAQVQYIKDAFSYSGLEPVVHVHPHPAEAGAIGCAMLAAAEAAGSGGSGWVGFEALGTLHCETEQSERTRCRGCANRCARTIIRVHSAQAGWECGGETLIIAPCERGRTDDALVARRILLQEKERNIQAPNFAREMEEMVFSPKYIAQELRQMYGNSDAAPEDGVIPPGLCIGIPRVLNFYSYAPLFIAWFLALGFREDQIRISRSTTRRMSSTGTARATMDPCFPAKICFAHIEELLREGEACGGESWIFFPAILRLPGAIADSVDSMTCTVTAVMPEAVNAAYMLEGNDFARRGARYLHPFLSMESLKAFSATMASSFETLLPFSRGSFRQAAERAWALQEQVMRTIRSRARATLESLEAERKVGLVLLGRPYHADNGLNHGVLEALHRMGFPLFTAETLPRDEEILERLFGGHEQSVRDVWPNPYSENSSRKMWAAKYAARHPNLLAVELSNFKCGHDAPTYSVVRDIFQAAGKPFFSFLDLDENTPRNTLNIRIETIQHFLKQWCGKRNFLPPQLKQKEAVCVQQQ